MKWPKVALGELASILSGYAFKSSRFNSVGKGLPLIRIRDVKSGSSKTFYHGEYAERFLIFDGDLLVGMDGEFNCAPWSGGQALLNQRVCRVAACSSRLDQNYLRQYLPIALKEIEGRTSFVTVKHLSSKEVAAIEIPLPPLPEQQRIAAILDQADALRRLRRRSLSRLNELGQSVFQEMFRDRSREWLEVELGSKIDFLTSGSRGWARYYTDEGASFIRIQNVKRGYFDHSDMAFVNAPKSAESRRTRVKSGDVLISITADLGRAAVVPDKIGEAYINQHLAIIRTDAFNPHFLVAALTSPKGQRSIFKKDRSAVKSGMNFDDIRTLPIIFPPRVDQDEFAERLLQISKMECRYNFENEHLDALFASLQHRAFRGEL